LSDGNTKLDEVNSQVKKKYYSNGFAILFSERCAFFYLSRISLEKVKHCITLFRITTLYVTCELTKRGIE